MSVYKTTKSVKKRLQSEYELNCEQWLLELSNIWEHDCHYGYWVGDAVGGTYCMEDKDLFIEMSDVRYCVMNDVPRKVYSEWVEYCVWAHDFNQDIPNLQSWCKGCPRVSKDGMKKLSDMKANLAKVVEDTKNELRKRGC